MLEREYFEVAKRYGADMLAGEFVATGSTTMILRLVVIWGLMRGSGLTIPVYIPILLGTSLCADVLFHHRTTMSYSYPYSELRGIEERAKPS